MSVDKSRVGGWQKLELLLLLQVRWCQKKSWGGLGTCHIIIKLYACCILFVWFRAAQGRGQEKSTILRGTLVGGRLPSTWRGKRVINAQQRTHCWGQDSASAVLAGDLGRATGSKRHLATERGMP